jgi:hypothetical protein
MLGKRAPFHDILHEGCIRQLLAATLVAGPTRGFSEGADFAAPHPYPVRNWFSTEHGIGLCDAPLMHQTGLKAFLLIPGEGQVALNGVRLAPARIPSLFFGSLMSGTTSLSRFLMPCFAAATRVFVMRDSPHAFASEDFELESEDAGGTLFQKGLCPPAATDFAAAASELRQSPAFKWIGLLAEYYPHPKAPEPTRLSRAWNEIIRVPVIPFSMADRREQLPHAFEELRDYLDDRFEVFRPTSE